MKMNSNDTRNKASADSKKSFHEHVLSTYHQNALALNKSPLQTQSSHSNSSSNQAYSGQKP